MSGVAAVEWQAHVRICRFNMHISGDPVVVDAQAYVQVRDVASTVVCSEFYGRMQCVDPLQKQL